MCLQKARSSPCKTRAIVCINSSMLSNKNYILWSYTKLGTNKQQSRRESEEFPMRILFRMCNTSQLLHIILLMSSMVTVQPQYYVYGTYLQWSMQLYGPQAIMPKLFIIYHYSSLHCHRIIHCPHHLIHECFLYKYCQNSSMTVYSCVLPKQQNSSSMANVYDSLTV